MIRPMTSNVSALSGIVANGHQAIHFVSSAPSKIPYGGFSPVRLQTRLSRRPPSQAFPRPLIGRHRRYLVSRRFIRSGSCDQAAPRTSDHDRESSGPWLPNRLFCPARSSLTMATSAPLPTTRRFMPYSGRLRVQPASRRGSPIYSASPFTPCRCPYSGGSNDCVRQCLRRRWCLRHICTGSAATIPTNPYQVACVTKLQRSLNAAAWTCCLPCIGQGFYDRACVDRVTPKTHVGYNWMVHCHLPSPDSHRLDWQPYGLQTDWHGWGGPMNAEGRMQKKGRSGVGLGVLWRWSGGGLTLIAQSLYTQRLTNIATWLCGRLSAACIAGPAPASLRCGTRNYMRLRHLHIAFGSSPFPG